MSQTASVDTDPREESAASVVGTIKPTLDQKRVCSFQSIKREFSVMGLSRWLAGREL